MTLRALARELGVSEGAVRAAVRRGRLARSVARDTNGRPFVVDAALAAEEWDQSTKRPRAEAATDDRDLDEGEVRELIEAALRVALDVVPEARVDAKRFYPRVLLDGLRARGDR